MSRNMLDVFPAENPPEAFVAAAAAVATAAEATLRSRPARSMIPLGCPVRVRGGVFAGLEGTVASYSSSSRLIVELRLDRSGVTLEVEDRALKRLDS